MRRKITTIIGVAGFGLALAACSGASDTAETAEENQAAEEAETAPESFVVDQTGELSEELGPEMLTGVNERLAAHYSETGNNVQILIVDTTNGADIAETATAAMEEAGSDAMIYIAGGDQAIGVVGTGIDEAEAEGVVETMVSAFDNGNFEAGFSDGIAATADAMSN